ncbi:MAG: GNAT family N-acetyltransferase [Myxococcales bacterium]|nr:GNAT family N-acetyltransferase [Myxococcales bacterium]
MKRESQRAPKTPTAHHTDRSKVTVREMEIDDLASVFHLGEKLFTSESYPILYRTWDAYEVTGLFHSDSDYCLVAEGPDEELLGFVMGTTIDKGTAWTYGYVTWLGVAPGWQRAGVGQQLMDAIEDRMLETEDVRMFIVDTSAHNHRGIRFFQKLGFEQMQKHVYLWKTLKGDAEARVRSVKRRRRARQRVGERSEEKKG